MRPKKMYVIVQRNLGHSQRAVQGGHALAQYLLDHPTDWDNGIIVFLGVKSESHLLQWAERLQDRQKRFSMFREPDIDDQVTAIAAVDDSGFFNKLNLL